MNRTFWQALASQRALEAKALLDAGHWSGAYYLVGYAVECGLKACVLAHVELTGAIFEDRRYSEKCWTHDADELVKLAGLEASRRSEISRNPAFGISWVPVAAWSEAARYRLWTEFEARQLFHAVTDATEGVLPWIMARC